MLDFTDHLAVGLNNSHQTDIIYFDFSKAFDSVSHDLILEKLKEKFNINGKFLRFFKMYLKDRKQRVVIDGEFSDWVNVRSGVPQGSILGPALFVIFINDIIQEVSSPTHARLYADDMKIWRHIRNTNDQAELQNDINKLHSWSVANKIRFHPSKCKLIRSTLKRNPLLTQYSLNNIPISESDHERDLGVIISPKLSYLKQHQALVSKASQKLGLLKRSCSITHSHISRKTLYLSLVRSNFEHCSPVWRPVTTLQINKFEGIQKRAVKWILNENYTRYNTREYYQKLTYLNILPMSLKFKLNDIIMFHKIYYRNSIIHFPTYIHRQTDNDGTIFQRQTRLYSDQDRLKVKCSVNPKVNSFKNSFFYRCQIEWNNLPLELRSLENAASFKTSLKKYLWTFIELELSETDTIT